MLQWMDNFGSYGTTASYMLNGLYAAMAGTLTADPDPLATGTVFRVDANPVNPKQTLRKVLSSTQPTIGVAFRIWLSRLPDDTAQNPMLQFQTEINTNLVALSVNPTGSLTISLNGNSASSPGTTIESTVGPVLIADAWQHVECMVTFDTVAGEYGVRVEGITVLDGTGANTKGSGTTNCAIVAFSNKANGIGSSVTMYIKDLVVYDGTGAHNNDFLGSVSVFRLTPNSDVTLGGWTTSSGATGYNLINESPPVDTSYVQADITPPAPCEFNLTNLPPDITSVRGLMTLVRAQKTDGGDADLQVSVGSAGSYANGADRPITTAFTYWYDIQEEDPATSALWTPAAVDSATLQLDRTT
jgi:hypothetical protein